MDKAKPVQLKRRVSVIIKSQNLLQMILVALLLSGCSSSNKSYNYVDTSTVRNSVTASVSNRTKAIRRSAHNPVRVIPRSRWSKFKIKGNITAMGVVKKLPFITLMTFQVLIKQQI
jgi:hypothetical protein